MNKWYNFYNFEASFKKFLIAENLSPVTLKNYLSDLRHFLGWSILKLKSKNEKINLENINYLDFLEKINEPIIEEYKNYLIINSIPLKTINRRLSTIRKFFSFCISQGWLNQNPAKKIKNENFNKEEILKSFQEDLKKENLDQNTIKSYLITIREFLNL